VTGRPGMGKLRVALLTREYPPEVYGGAGVHVTYLARELGPLVDLTVHCQGADRPDAVAHRPWDLLADANQALQVVSTDLSMAAAVGSAELVHSHTWYANLAGHLAGMLYGIPHVMTMHSLEVLRPWKAEQLGGGYAVSSWCERTAATSAAAVVAVSDGMRADIMAAYPEISPERIRVIRNGIDTTEYRPDPRTEILNRYGVDQSRPYVIFVGRITRQKGVPVLLRAASRLIPEAQLVLAAGQADTPELLAEVTELVDGLRTSRSGVVWIPEMLAKPEVIQLLTHATVFACPSVYEPLGIVNLEAMACGTAVVGSRTGGIPEVVAEGETGLLVRPGDPEALAAALNALLSDPDRAEAMGQAGRKRVVAEFGWPAIAAQTADLYAELAHSGLKRPRLPGRDQAAVDPEVSARDVGGPVAGQQEDQVGDLLRTAEPAGHRTMRGLALDVLGLRAGGAADGLRDAVVAEPQIGGYRARANRVDPDAPGPDLLGQGLAEAGQGRLDRAVVQHAGVGQGRVDRTDGHDRPLPGRQHGGQRAAGGTHRGHQVEREGGLPVRIGDAQEPAGPGRRPADVVDQDVRSRGGPRDQPGRSVRIGQVHLENLHRTVLGQLIEFRGGRSRPRDDMRAVSHQAAGNREPDSPAGAGDDGGPSRQAQVHRVPSFLGGLLAGDMPKVAGASHSPLLS
jgi:alpha-maltose-1-phosphate synthase